jgi:hypothetical protein
MTNDEGAAEIYVILHMYKAAGTTLFANLRRGFGPKQLLPMYVEPIGLDVDKRLGSRANPGWIADPVQQYVARNVTSRTRCLCGHMAYCGVHEAINPPRAARYVTFLRDPVERTISLYYYLRSTTNYWHRELVEADWSLDEWLEKSQALWMLDGQVRQLLLGTYAEVSTAREIGRPHLEEAKRRLRQFWYVGLAETFADDADYLFGKMRFYRFSPKPVHNATPEKAEVSSQTRRLIARHNQLDLELYELGRELHGQFNRQHWLNVRWNQFRARLRRYRFERGPLKLRRR